MPYTLRALLVVVGGLLGIDDLYDLAVDVGFVDTGAQECMAQAVLAE